MKSMKPYLLVALAVFLVVAGVLWAANYPPILSGTSSAGNFGSVQFPQGGVSPRAYIYSDGSGGLHVVAGGSNQNVTLTPTGTGWAQTPGAFVSTGSGGIIPSTSFTWLALNGGAGDLLAYQGGVGFLPMGIRGSRVTITAGNLGPGNNTSPNYALDTTGDTNTSGVFRQGGTAGVGGSITINTTSASGVSSITPTTGTAIVSVGCATAIIQYKDWSGTNQAASVCIGTTFSTGSFVVSISNGTTNFLTGASATSNTFSGGIRIN